MSKTTAPSPAHQSKTVAKIYEALTKVKYAARVKQRTVENLIESAQAVHAKTLKKFNDHIDTLEHEKVRLFKELEEQKEANEKANEESLESKAALLALKKALAGATKTHAAEARKLKGEYDIELEAITKTTQAKSDKDEYAIAELEKEKSGLIELRDELQQKVATLENTADRLKDEHDQEKRTLSLKIDQLSGELTNLQSEKEAMQAKLEQFQRAWDNMG